MIFNPIVSGGGGAAEFTITNNHVYGSIMSWPSTARAGELVTASEAYYKAGADVSELYYREFAPNENDYWLHILRTMDTSRLAALCLKNLGKIPI